jgi:hypothetical protein
MPIASLVNGIASPAARLGGATACSCRSPGVASVAVGIASATRGLLPAGECSCDGDGFSAALAPQEGRRRLCGEERQCTRKFCRGRGNKCRQAAERCRNGGIVCPYPCVPEYDEDPDGPDVDVMRHEPNIGCCQVTIRYRCVRT